MEIAFIVILLVNMFLIVLQSYVIHSLEDEVFDVYKESIQTINNLNKKVEEIENGRK